MSFEYDPVMILQKEILKTQEAKAKAKNLKKKGWSQIKDGFVYEDSDQDFINDYVSSSGYYIERE